MLNRPEVPQGLNAAQMQKVQEVVNEWAAKAQLRQWCVEKALQAGSSDPVKLANEIYLFVAGVPVMNEGTMQ